MCDIIVEVPVISVKVHPISAPDLGKYGLLLYLHFIVVSYILIWGFIF